jgi:hypothetical protein
MSFRRSSAAIFGGPEQPATKTMNRKAADDQSHANAVRRRFARLSHVQCPLLCGFVCAFACVPFDIGSRLHRSLSRGSSTQPRQLTSRDANHIPRLRIWQEWRAAVPRAIRHQPTGKTPGSAALNQSGNGPDTVAFLDACPTSPRERTIGSWALVCASLPWGASPPPGIYRFGPMA